MINIILELQDRLITVALLYARITPIFMILPVLNSSVLGNNFIRNAVILAIIIGLWPAIDLTLPVANPSILEYVGLAMKEVLIGSTIGFVSSIPFWIFNAFGAYIDVARGSSMGSMIDPTSGQESTEIQNFINFCVCAVYLQLGGLNLLMEGLVLSYQNIGLKQGLSINLNQVVPFLGEVFNNGFILAAPVLLTLLMSEVLLGLLSRFTPQLNAFSVSMTIKSVIAIFVLSLYFWHIMPEYLTQYMHDYAEWNLLYGVKRP